MARLDFGGSVYNLPTKLDCQSDLCDLPARLDFGNNVYNPRYCDYFLRWRGLGTKRVDQRSVEHEPTIAEYEPEYVEYE